MEKANNLIFKDHKATESDIVVENDKIKIYAGIDGKTLYFVEVKKSLLNKALNQKNAYRN